MNPVPCSSLSNVPSIHIRDADDASILFNDSMFAEAFNLYELVPTEETAPYTCSQGLQTPYNTSNNFPARTAELEEISELSHLSTTQEYLTGPAISLPYSTIMQENGTSSGLSPYVLGSPIASPSSSFGSPLSSVSAYDSVPFSDFESPSPSATSDHHYIIPIQESSYQNTDSLDVHPFAGSFSGDAVSPAFLAPQSGPHRNYPRTSISRRGSVASKAMLEANSRRRRHPAQFICKECDQTFTALFSLRRHEQSHTGERPYACSIPGCEQRFFNNSDCKRHEKSKKRHKDLVMMQ